MLTQRGSLAYSDFFNVENEDINLTPENAGHVIFSSDRCFHIGTTDLMERFLSDKKSYLVFNFGLYENCTLNLVAKYEVARHVSKTVPSISMIKATAIEEPWFQNSNGKISVKVKNERMRPLLQSIVDSLPFRSNPGLYTIETPTFFKAQIESDRSGFRKVWLNGQLLDEKNYGDCSIVFSVVGIFLR